MAKQKHKDFELKRRQSVRPVKQSFLIVCEGENTEPDYFKAFRMTSATIRVVGQAMNTITLVKKAISLRDVYNQKNLSFDQCWVVFDKDDFPAKNFNNAILLAKQNGFNVAYSNQAFEYWFLLHYNLYKGKIHRDRYSEMLGKLTGMTYNKKEGYGATMYNLLLSRQPQAITNADKVLSEISKGNPANEESSTTVHLLVQELNKFL